MTALLPHIEINPQGNADCALILLHGLGADGHDFEPVVAELLGEKTQGMRVILPHAPIKSVTINAGFQMPAWYDILGTELMAIEDELGIRQSQQQIELLIEREIERGIPSQRIFLAGFSQGGAMALYGGLRYTKPLGGIIALSTYLPIASKLPVERHAVNAQIPIFMAHGTLDPIVLFSYATASKDFLTNLSYSVQWHTYPMAHSLCEQEIVDLRNWLNR
jgi:phospholipase/carboxylesterase